MPCLEIVNELGIEPLWDIIYAHTTFSNIMQVEVVWAGTEKTRRIYWQESDFGRERPFVERIVRGGNARPTRMEACHKNHRPHIKVGKDAEEVRAEVKHRPTTEQT